MPTKESLDRIGAAAVGPADKRYAPEYYLLRYRLKRLLPFCRGPRVLEMGCAGGGMTRELAQAFPDVSVVEGSPLLIEEARKHVADPRVTFHCALFEEFEPEHRFDDVVSSHVIEHLSDPVAVLRTAARWLAPGGRLHVLVPNAAALNRRVGVAMGALTRLDELHAGDQAVGHLRVYTWDTLLADLHAADLVVDHMDGILLKPLSNAQMEGWDLPLLDALYDVGREFPSLCSEIYALCRPSGPAA